MKLLHIYMLPVLALTALAAEEISRRGGMSSMIIAIRKTSRPSRTTGPERILLYLGRMC